MPEPRATGPLPPDVAVRVRAYLAAFLPPTAIDEAVDEVTDDSRFWGDTDAVEVLAVAHTVLGSRLRVAPEVEVLVLQEDVGLTVPEIAGVLGLPATEVRGMLDEALAVLADPELADASPGGTAPSPSQEAGRPPAADAPASPPPATPAPASAPSADRPSPARGARRRQRLVVLAVVFGVVLVALGAAWLLGGDGGCPGEADVCVTEAVLTDAVDPGTGAPGPDRDVFGTDDQITLWFSFERRTPDAGPLEVSWYREGMLLYGTEVRLGDDDRLNVSLAALWSEEPGRYRVEVADGAHILAERDFRVTDEA
jgi:hypothetical protein